jgi:DNA-binding MurR/RpiR family transcriptional regulator
MESMAPADREIGRFILDKPEQMLGMSTSALAAATGRSQSSVVKFSQKLGFASYQDLKLSVSNARTAESHLPGGFIHGTIERDDSFMTVVQKLVSSKLHSIQQTVAANSGAGLERALTALNAARRIHLTGVGSSALVARDFAFKLMKLGRAVIHDADSHVQMANAATLGPQDVLFALSHSGASVETLRISELAHSLGATVIAVTMPRDNPLSRVASIWLQSHADEDRVRSSAITARDAQLTLTDLLFILLVQRQPDAAIYIHNSENAVEALKQHRPEQASRRGPAGRPAG